MEVEVGQLVYPKCGRDQGCDMVIVQVSEPYVFLADGKKRKLDKPKKKKKIHLQTTHYVDEALGKKLSEGAYVLDADLRKMIKQYKEKRSV
ncbi:MAG: RNA-binding protein [Bacillota bacterium]